MNDKPGVPLAILQEAYRPLLFFANEILEAAAPFLPDLLLHWVHRWLIPSPSPFAEDEPCPPSP